MCGNIIPFIKQKLDSEVCGICSNPLTKERVTLKVFSAEEERSLAACAPCGELARKPREEIQGLINEAKEEIMKDQNEKIKSGQLLQ